MLKKFLCKWIFLFLARQIALPAVCSPLIEYFIHKPIKLCSNLFLSAEVDVYPDGFLIPTPAGITFLSPSYFNDQHDPFIHMEKTTMEEGDILISSACKTGRLLFCHDTIQWVTRL